MPNADENPRWIKMYEDFVAQTDPAEINHRLKPLESSIAERISILRSFGRSGK